MNTPAIAWGWLCYCVSAVVVILCLYRFHYNRHLTWMEAFQLQGGDQAWMLVAIYALIPGANTVLALEFLLFPSAFDRINDD